jgi:hypothetical protein
MMAGANKGKRRSLGGAAGLLAAVLLLAGAQAAAAFIVPVASRIRPVPTGVMHGSGSMVGYRTVGVPLAALQPPQPRRGALSMLKEPQGSDAFARMLEEEGRLGPLNKLSSGPAKAIKFTSIPLAAVGGFLGVPAAAGPMFKVFGGVVGALALRAGNRRLRKVCYVGG